MGELMRNIPYSYTTHETMDYFPEDTMIRVWWKDEESQHIDYTTDLFPTELAECAYDTHHTMDGVWWGLSKVRIMMTTQVALAWSSDARCLI